MTRAARDLEGRARGAARALTGVGLGLRWDFLEEVVDGPALPLDFFEVSPENYMRRGGYYPAQLARVKERYPLVSHGLMLSIGASREPEPEYLRELRDEVERLGTPWHSDHLCFSSAGERFLHELLPLKRTRDTADRIADRASSVEERLGVPFALENISYYAEVGRSELPEPEFLMRILEQSSAKLLLDVNNVYVNSVNHGFDPFAYVSELDLGRVLEIHVAGHARRPNGLVIDDHGSRAIAPVLELLAFVLERTGPVAVLLERDNHVPPLPELIAEVETIRRVYERAVLRHGELSGSAA